mgnify:CR=1 FL=1
MNFTKAFAVFMQIDSKEFTEDEKYEAIQQVLDAATINSITKKQVLNVVSWLFNKQQKYRWHDLRKNPDDLPDVPHPERTWFEVVQEDNEDCIPRATMQYDDEYGFGFYQEIYAARSFGYVDTEFKTVEELNLAPVVLLDRITAENSQLQQILPFGRRRNIVIRPIRKSCGYTIDAKLIVNTKFLKTENICLQISHVRSNLLA